MIRPTAPTSSPIEAFDLADDPDAVALALARSALPFDIGCAHLLPGHAGAGRCQLWIGHQGEHAVMFVRDGIRLVRSWNEQNLPRVHDGTDGRSQPWVHGFPRPAWHEGCPTAAHDLVPSRSATSRTAADAMVHRPKVEPVTSTVADLHRLFVDPHVSAALIVVDDVLITVVDRDDVHSALHANTPATSLGTLVDRTVEPDASLEAAQQQLISTGRRRLAVIDGQQRLLGLLCLKRTRDGFCSEEDLQSRQAETCRSTTGGSSTSSAQGYASDLAWTAPLDGGRRAS